MTAPSTWSAGRRRGLRALAAAAALAVAWIAAPHAFPIYDGIGVPDEPYRYVSPPPGATKTPPPTSMVGTSPGQNGSNKVAFYVNTGEVGPQFGAFVTLHVMTGPADTKTFKLTATPEAPPAGKTPYGLIIGNVYQVQLWADASPTAGWSAEGKTSVEFIMRATSAKVPAVTLLYRPTATSPWTALPNTRYGTDTFEGLLQGAGEYALTPAKAKADSSSHTLAIVGLVVVVGCMILAVVLIRVARRTTPPPT